MRFEVKGVNKVKNNLRAMPGLATTAAAAALYRAAEEVVSAAKEAAPHRTGALKGSGTVLPPDVRGDRIEVELGFGGAAAPYAAVQHETHPTKSKYLERPFLERASRVDDEVADAVGEALKRGTKK